jgi:hypothetical protein
MPSDLLERLYNDESLTDNLTDDQAQCLYAWAGHMPERPASGEDAEAVIAAIRRLNRDVGEGAEFEECFAAMKNILKSES